MSKFDKAFKVAMLLIIGALLFALVLVLKYSHIEYNTARTMYTPAKLEALPVTKQGKPEHTTGAKLITTKMPIQFPAMRRAKKNKPRRDKLGGRRGHESATN